LVVGKSHSTPADLLLQNAVFFDEIFNDLLLPLIEPTSNRNHKE